MIGIDVNNKSPPKECNVCHYLYFLEKEFTFQRYVYNESHDLTQKAMSLGDVDEE